METKRLFQQIFGSDYEAIDAGEVISRVAEKYPYFIAPVLFSDKVQFSHPEIAARKPLFFHTPIQWHYALHETPIEDEMEFILGSKINLTEETTSASEQTDSTQFQQNESHPDHLQPETEQESQPQLNDDQIAAKEPEQTAIEDPSAPNHTNEIIEPVNQPQPGTAEVDNQQKMNAASDELIFEPLHTTDYFASQGIKIVEDPIPNDKLGTQLRSFTDWLKTMKKLPGTSANPVLNTPYDRKVEQLAEKSNQEEEVITESMAEACIAQGKRQKAIEIYEKLSLQNPSKSAYFAAKIAKLSSGANMA